MAAENKNRHEIEFISYWSLSVALTFTATTIYKMVSESNFQMAYGLQRFIAIGIIAMSVIISIFNGYELLHYYGDNHTNTEDHCIFDTIHLLFSISMLCIWIVVQMVLAIHIATHKIVLD